MKQSTKPGCQQPSSEGGTTPAEGAPVTNPSILQVWKRHDLGLGWTVSFLSDGSATFYNSKTDQRLDLPKYSVETLRNAVRRADAEGRSS